MLTGGSVVPPQRFFAAAQNDILRERCVGSKRLVRAYCPRSFNSPGLWAPDLYRPYRGVWLGLARADSGQSLFRDASRVVAARTLVATSGQCWKGPGAAVQGLRLAAGQCDRVLERPASHAVRHTFRIRKKSAVPLEKVQKFV